MSERNTNPITTVIVDDDDDVRGVLRANLSVDRRFLFLAEANNGEDAARLCEEHQPDLVVLDLMMPGVNGAQVLQEIRSTCPGTKVAMFTAASVGVASSLTGYEADQYISKTEMILDVMDKLADLAHGLLAAPRPPTGPVISLPRDTSKSA